MTKYDATLLVFFFSCVTTAQGISKSDGEVADVTFNEKSMNPSGFDVGTPARRLFPVRQNTSRLPCVGRISRY
jgi:hypothetical protein